MEDEHDDRSIKATKPSYNDDRGSKSDDYVGDSSPEDLLKWPD